jgi:general secretion pathway protein J
MRRKLHRPPAQTAGFTLIEMLIALVLIGLLTAALFGGLRFAARASDRATAAADHAADLATTYSFLQAQLGNAQPYPATADPKDQQILFDGAPDQIEVITTSPSRLAMGGFFHLHLAVIDVGGELRLLAEWREPPRQDEAPPDTVLKPSILLDHLRGVRFAFFGTTDPESPSDWHDRWQGATALPKMIRLRVEFADGWQVPDLIVAPRLAAGPGVNG